MIGDMLAGQTHPILVSIYFLFSCLFAPIKPTLGYKNVFSIEIETQFDLDPLRLTSIPVIFSLFPSQLSPSRLLNNTHFYRVTS